MPDRQPGDKVTATVADERTLLGNRGGEYKRKRPKRYTDTEEFGRMVQRMLTSYGKRVGGADMADFEQLLELEELLDKIQVEAVASLRTTGYSWASIGDAAGMTRQAAQQRWGRRRG